MPDSAWFAVSSHGFPGTFDFSQQFEEAVLSLVPSLLLLLLAPARYLLLLPKGKCTGGENREILKWIKLVRRSRFVAHLEALLIFHRASL